MIGLIMSLLEKGYAYQTSSGVYFRVSSQPDYGSLSHRKVTEALDNYRISNDQQKEDPQDFALWKKTTEGLNFPSPFGEGRPGWHTECVAMNDAIFEHQTLDIHGGGMDLLFPHHENENAQFQALTGHPLAKTWMHCNFLNMGDAKMSKSLGNIKPGKEVVDEYGAMGTRLFLLSNHYRSPLKCEDSILQEFSLKGKNILKSLRGLALRLKIDASLADLYQTIPENEASLEAFVTILDADLNTATALSNIFEDQKKINQIRQLDSEGMILYKTWIKKLDLLGLAPRFRVTPEVVKTYQKYEEARKNQDYALSDKYRQILIEEGYL
jgi:cysteinyl-tRNA synthetase